ncbi:zinc finger and BTB domain-containing protein 49-like [Clytia hemisphaerica]|uniref:C2H2-type domain-containing protein n=1 Tax=Clytia hemisphaerica TaxID=252671 RepID=A0A7M5USQ4_9CNID
MEQDVPRAALAVMEIENILAASFGENGKRCYKVQWKESWVFEDHLFSCKPLVEKFWKNQKQDPTTAITISQNTEPTTRGTKRVAKGGGGKKNMKVIVISNKEKKDGGDVVHQTQHVDNEEAITNTDDIDGDWILDGLNQDDDSSKENDNSWFVTAEMKKIRPTGAKYTLSCHICPNEEFEAVSTFRRHYITMHPGVKAFSCDVCQKRFDRKENLMRHIRIHTGDRRYICNFCGKGYTDPSGLKKHVNAKHANEKKIFKCDICQDTFPNKVILDKHYVQHDASTDPALNTEPSDGEHIQHEGRESGEDTLELHTDGEISAIQKSNLLETSMDQSEVVTDDETTTIEVLMEKSPENLSSSTTNSVVPTTNILEATDIKDTEQPMQNVVKQLQQFVDEQVVQYVQVTNTAEQTQSQPVTLNSPTLHHHQPKTFIFNDATAPDQQSHFVIPISAPQLLINPAGGQNNLRQVLPAVSNHQQQIITVPLTPSSFVYTGPLTPHHPPPQTSNDSLLSDGT